MFGIGWNETKVFLIIIVILCAFPLLFIPISTWEEVFWRYLNETAPILWIGQLGWILFGGLLITIGYFAVERIFFK